MSPYPHGHFVGHAEVINHKPRRGLMVCPGLVLQQKSGLHFQASVIRILLWLRLTFSTKQT